MEWVHLHSLTRLPHQHISAMIIGGKMEMVVARLRENVAESAEIGRRFLFILCSYLLGILKTWQICNMYMHVLHVYHLVECMHAHACTVNASHAPIPNACTVFAGVKLMQSTSRPLKRLASKKNYFYWKSDS